MRLPEAEHQGRTLIHRASPRLKLAVLLVLLTCIVLLPRRPHVLYWAPAGALALAWAVARMPLAHAFRRLAVAQLFIVSVSLLSLFTPSAWPVFLGTVLKSNLCVLAMVLLTWTTPFQQILHELRALKFPSVMVTTLALMYRYLPVLTEESRRMQRARASRTFGTGRTLAWRNLSAIAAQLFVRTAGRAERIYLAMCARGWK